MVRCAAMRDADVLIAGFRCAGAPPALALQRAGSMLPVHALLPLTDVEAARPRASVHRPIAGGRVCERESARRFPRLAEAALQ